MRMHREARSLLDHYTMMKRCVFYPISNGKPLQAFYKASDMHKSLLTLFCVPSRFQGAKLRAQKSLVRRIFYYEIMVNWVKVIAEEMARS